MIMVLVISVTKQAIGQHRADNPKRQQGRKTQANQAEDPKKNKKFKQKHTHKI